MKIPTFQIFQKCSARLQKIVNFPLKKSVLLSKIRYCNFYTPAANPKNLMLRLFIAFPSMLEKNGPSSIDPVK